MSVNVLCKVSVSELFPSVLSAGMVYGSLHFITFDGTEYSFKALGEFVIVRLSSYTGSNIFTLQGETCELKTDGQARRVPTVVRMAAFHQGIGKVSVLWGCVCVCVWLMGCIMYGL